MANTKSKLEMIDKEQKLFNEDNDVTVENFKPRVNSCVTTDLEDIILTNSQKVVKLED